MNSRLYKYSIKFTFSHTSMGFSKTIYIELTNQTPDIALEKAKQEVLNCFGITLFNDFTFESPKLVNRDVCYIVYNKFTLKIISVFKFMGADLTKLLSSDKSFSVINITNPINFHLLANINRINSTNYQ